MKMRTVFFALVLVGLGVVLFLPAEARAGALPGLDDICLHTNLEGCSVLASGYIEAEDGPRIAFQTQAGFTRTDGVMGGVVLFREDGGNWLLFADAFDAYRYDVPHLVAHEAILLHVPGYTGGTGAYNADLLFVWGDAGASIHRQTWRRIDIESWRADIDALLPEGLGIWQGVDYDFDDWFYDSLTARTPLWREGDGNCCATGGEALIDFEIVEDRLEVKSVRYLPPQDAPQ